MTCARFLRRVAFLALLGAPSIAAAQRGDAGAGTGRFLTVGLFIASIEEGARVFTPVRLLPFDHPEAYGHEFPTVEQFHGGEERILITLGRSAGLLLQATLLRYPSPPDSTWPYRPFEPPPVQTFTALSPLRRPADTAPIPGLRAVAFLDGFPLAFIIDTRGLSLAARHMQRATTSGLDITRQQLLTGLAAAAATGPASGPWLLVYSGP